MQRSVIQLAGKTLVVSLPAKWCRDNGVKKGNTIEITEGHGGLTVTPTAHAPSNKTLSLDLTKQPGNVVWRTLNNAYRSGASRIELQHGTTPIVEPRTKKEMSVLAFLHNAIPRWTGMDIADQGKKHTSIHETAIPTTDGLDQSIIRLVHLTKSAVNETDTDSINVFEEQNNRLADSCQRIINRSNTLTNGEAAANTLIIRGLEQLCDEIRQLSATQNGRTALQRIAPVLLEGLDVFLRQDIAQIMMFHATRQRGLDSRAIDVLIDILDAQQMLLYARQ